MQRMPIVKPCIQVLQQVDWNRPISFDLACSAHNVCGVCFIGNITY